VPPLGAPDLPLRVPLDGDRAAAPTARALAEQRASGPANLAGVPDSGERLQSWSKGGLRAFLYMFLLFTVIETIVNLFRFDLWSLPLGAYYVFLYAVLIRNKVWQWPQPEGPWVRRWLSRPRNLAFVGTGVACFILDTVGDVRREGALLALAPVLGVLLLFAVCYVLSVPIAWVVAKYRLRQDS
jgi:hypothetical protein